MNWPWIYHIHPILSMTLYLFIGGCCSCGRSLSRSLFFVKACRSCGHLLQQCFSSFEDFGWTYGFWNYLYPYFMTVIVLDTIGLFNAQNWIFIMQWLRWYYRKSSQLYIYSSFGKPSLTLVMATSSSSTVVYSIFWPQYWKLRTWQARGLKWSLQGHGFPHLKHFPSAHALLMSIGTPPWALKVPGWFRWTSVFGVGVEDVVAVVSTLFPSQFLLKVVWPPQCLQSAILARIASARVNTVSYFAKLSDSKRLGLLLSTYLTTSFRTLSRVSWIRSRPWTQVLYPALSVSCFSLTKKSLTESFGPCLGAMCFLSASCLIF